MTYSVIQAILIKILYDYIHVNPNNLGLIPREAQRLRLHMIDALALDSAPEKNSSFTFLWQRRF